MSGYSVLWEQSAKSGLTIYLDHRSIVELLTFAKAGYEQRKVIEKEIEHAVQVGNLKAKALLRDPDSEGGFRDIPTVRWRLIKESWYNGSYVNYEIHKDDFKGWLERTNKWPLPDDCLLSYWWRTEIQIFKEVKKRREKQIEIIVKTIELLAYNPKAIPDGGKQIIKKECLKDKILFTASAFDHAWKAAKKPPYNIQIINPEKYTSKVKI